MDRFSIFDIDDSANILSEPFLKYSPTKKWSIRRKQLRLPANGGLEGLLLPLKGLLNLDEDDRVRFFLKDMSWRLDSYHHHYLCPHHCHHKHRRHHHHHL